MEETGHLPLTLNIPALASLLICWENRGHPATVPVPISVRSGRVTLSRVFLLGASGREGIGQGDLQGSSTAVLYLGGVFSETRGK